MVTRATRGRDDDIATSVRISRDMLAGFRKTRARLIEAYIGSGWNDRWPSQRKPMNFMAVATLAYTRAIAARSPRPAIIARSIEFAPIARDMELVLADRLETMNFADEMQQVALNAMTGCGCMKVGVAKSSEGVQPFAMNVSFDDLVFDPNAVRWSDCQHIGDRWDMTFSQFADRWPDKEHLAVESILSTNEDGSVRTRAIGNQRSRMLRPADDGAKRIDLWDVWVPEDAEIRTYIGTHNGPTGEPIEVVSWNGPERGPYHRLAFSEVPDNVMPKPVVLDLADLNDLVNDLWRRLNNRARKEKELMLVRHGAEKDAQLIRDAQDGEVVGTADPDAMRMLRMGIIPNELLGLLLQARDQLGWLGGNIDAVAGLSPQAATLGQEQILQSGASVRIADMAERTHLMVRDVVRDLLHWIWTAPETYSFRKPIKGTRFGVTVKLEPGDRDKADFARVMIDIAMDSMRGQTPGQRLNTLMGYLNGTLIPMMPLLEQQGLTVDARAVNDIFMRYADAPELESIVVPMQADGTQESTMGGAGQSVADSFRPKNTGNKSLIPERRVREGFTTAAARNHELSQDLVAAGQNPGTDMRGPQEL